MQNIVKMDQVHGNNVVRVSFNDIGLTIPNCDALISNDSKVSLSVRVADCLPISIIDKKSQSIGLIHAGWRGLEKEVIGKCITMMKNEFGIKASELEIKIGPHICKRHYEVKSEVSSKFSNFQGAVIQIDEKEYLDLAELAVQQMLKNGVLKENILVDNRCTFEDINLHSYRRDKTNKRNYITFP